MAYNTRLLFRVWRLDEGYDSLFDYLSEPDETHLVYGDEVRVGGGAFGLGLNTVDDVVPSRVVVEQPTILRSFRCRKIPTALYADGTVAVRVEGADYLLSQVSGISRREDEVTLERIASVPPPTAEDE